MLQVSKSVIPGESDQDWVATHVTEDGATWGVCGDGHGAPRFPERRDFVQQCKELDWHAFFDGIDSHPGIALEAMIDEWGINTIGIGACICMFRMQEDTIDIWWRGDVMGVLYADGDQAFQTTRHNMANRDSSTPVAGRDIISLWQVSVLTPSTMTMVPDARINLNPQYRDRSSAFSGIEDECAIFNCLGHNNWAHGDWDHHRHTVDPAKKTKLVIGSDGLWDMLTAHELGHIDMCPSLTASALVAFCASRWRQEWRYQWQGRCVEEREVISNPDDVSCIMLSIGT